MKRRLNWKPDRPDFRDQKYSISKPKTYPSKVDLRPKCPPIVDQGDIGSCTGNALAGAIGFLEYATIKPESFQPFSRLFIYYNERVIEGDPGQDGGANIRDGIKTLDREGACFESLWGYSDELTFKKPTSRAYFQAQGHTITRYSSVNNTDINQLKDALFRGFPIVFGFTVYESFQSKEVGSTGMMPMPDRSESSLGGHAVLCVGYDDSIARFIVRNSWGTDWGDEGYFYMPYSYITNRDLANSFWTIQK